MTKGTNSARSVRDGPKLRQFSTRTITNGPDPQAVGSSGGARRRQALPRWRLDWPGGTKSGQSAWRTCCWTTAARDDAKATAEPPVSIGVTLVKYPPSGELRAAVSRYSVVALRRQRSGNPSPPIVGRRRRPCTAWAPSKGSHRREPFPVRR